MKRMKFLLVVAVAFAVSALAWLPSASAKMVIRDGAAAISWLQANGYIDQNRMPLNNFNVFRSLVLGGQVGPHGLAAIMAPGWSLSGPLTGPIGEPIVIIIDDESLNPVSFYGQVVTPTCFELGFVSTCTPVTFKNGAIFTCAGTPPGCDDQVFTITNVVGTKVEMWREDQVCPASPGLTASYKGVISGRRLEGERTIHNPGTGALRPTSGSVAPFYCDF